MKYIAQSRPSTLVVAGMPRGRAVAVSMRGILTDQGMEEDRRMLGLDAREMGDLVAARRPGRSQHVARLQLARRGQETPLADLPRHLVVILGVAERSGHPAAA